MPEGDPTTTSKIKDLESKLRQLDSRLAKANLRNLSLILAIERLIRMNSFREMIDSGAREGEKISTILDELWEETFKDVDDGT